jgi:hypothetical protein
MNDVLTLIASTAGITTAVKLLVDAVKAAAPHDLKAWVLPMLALAAGLIIAFLLVAAEPQTVWTLATIAAATLRGVFGGIGAVAVTEVHKMVRPGPRNDLERP